MESGQRNVRSRLGRCCEDVETGDHSDTMDSSRDSNDLRVTTLQYSHVETTSSLLEKLVDLKENLKKNGLKRDHKMNRTKYEHNLLFQSHLQAAYVELITCCAV